MRHGTLIGSFRCGFCRFIHSHIPESVGQNSAFCRNSHSGILFGLLYLAYANIWPAVEVTTSIIMPIFYGAIYGFLFPIVLEPRLFQAFLNHF